MFKLIYSVSFLIICLGCNSSTENKQTNETPARNEQAQELRNLEPFADSVVRLDKYNPAHIEKLAYYFKKLVPNEGSLADSAAVLVLNFVWASVDTVNQQLVRDTTDYTDLVYTGGQQPTEKQKAFQQSLNANHLNLTGNGEGDVLAIIDYNWLNGILQPKTSPPLDNYLSLLAAESIEPTLQDAALTIELKELISRIILTETLMSETLPASLAQNNKQNNKFYTDVLCLGTDNTPSLADEKKMTLTEEFKLGYAYLLATYPSSKAAEKIRQWLGIVKAKDRKKMEEMKVAMYQ